MFSKPAVKELLNRFSLVQLYTDAVPPYFQPTTSAEENRRLLNDMFGTAQLPLYVILKPVNRGLALLAALWRLVYASMFS